MACCIFSTSGGPALRLGPRPVWTTSRKGRVPLPRPSDGESTGRHHVLPPMEQARGTGRQNKTRARAEEAEKRGFGHGDGSHGGDAPRECGTYDWSQGNDGRDCVAVVWPPCSRHHPYSRILTGVVHGGMDMRRWTRAGHRVCIAHAARRSQKRGYHGGKQQ